MPNDPTYSQIEAACRAAYPHHDVSPEWRKGQLRCDMKAALIAAQGVDRNVYGHLHHGFSCDGVTLMGDSKESIDKVVAWHHITTTMPRTLEDLRNRLRREQRRATDAEYMIEALVPMLGPKARKIWKMWQDKGIKRIHHSWVVDPMTLEGEEVAQLHLDMEEACKNAIPVDNIDTYIAGLDPRGDMT